MGENLQLPLYPSLSSANKGEEPPASHHQNHPLLTIISQNYAKTMINHAKLFFKTNSVFFSDPLPCGPLLIIHVLPVVPIHRSAKKSSNGRFNKCEFGPVQMCCTRADLCTYVCIYLCIYVCAIFCLQIFAPRICSRVQTCESPHSFYRCVCAFVCYYQPATKY